MDYYPSSAIKSALKCAYCEAKFTFSVKLIPECGFSICSRCYEELKESIVIKSGEYECRACKRWHTMSSQGLADNLLAMEILKVRPEERALPDQALKLRALLDDARSHLERLAKFSGVDEVNRHCERLKDEIVKAVEARVDQIRKVGDDFLREVDDYRAGLAASSSEPPAAKRLKKTDEFAQIAADVQRFDAEWGEYFTRISKVVSEAELERAHEEAKSLGPRIEELERRTRSEAFGGRVLEWKESALVLFEKHQIGELVYDIHSTTTAAETNGVLSPVSENTSLVLETSCHTNDVSMSSSEPSPTQQPTKEPETQSKRGTKVNRLLATLSHPSKPIHDFVFLSDGALACSYADRSVKVWLRNGESKQPDIQLAETSAATLETLAHGWLAVGCKDGSIQIWELKKREFVRSLRGHTCGVFCLRRLPDGNLASIAWDNTIKIWNPYVEKGGLLASMHGHDIRWGEPRLEMLSNGHLLTCSIDNTHKTPCVVKIWDPKAGVLVKSIGTDYKDVSAVSVLSDDRLLFGFRSGRIRLFDIAREAEIKSLRVRLNDKIVAMAQLARGHLVACASSTDSRISVVDLDSDGVVETIETGHAKKLWTLRLAQDGRTLASSSGDHKIRLWSFM